MKEIKITFSDGYEIDKENSTEECIKLKDTKQTIIPSDDYIPIEILGCSPLKEGAFEEGDIVSNAKGDGIYVFKRVIYERDAIFDRIMDFEYYVRLGITGARKMYFDFDGKDCSYGSLRLATKKEKLLLFRALSHLTNPRIDSFEVNM